MKHDTAMDRMGDGGGDLTSNAARAVAAIERRDPADRTGATQ